MWDNTKLADLVCNFEREISIQKYPQVPAKVSQVFTSTDKYLHQSF